MAARAMNTRIQFHLSNILLAFHQLVKKKKKENVFQAELNNSCSWTKKQISQRTRPSAQVGVNSALLLSLKLSIHTSNHPSMMAFDKNNTKKNIYAC